MKYHLPNRQLWAFVPGREFKRHASSIYKQEWSKYVVVDNTKRISGMITKEAKKEFVKKKLAKELENYDSFKM